MTVVDSNALSLLQAEKSLNASKYGWVKTFASGVDLSGIIPMVPPNIILGYKYFEEAEGTVSNYSFRSLNENPTTSNDDPLIEKETKASFITTAISLDHRLNQADPLLLDKEIYRRVRKLAPNVTYNIINGASTTSSKNFIGLKEAITGNYLIGPSSALTIDADAASFRLFLSYWRQVKNLIDLDGNSEIFAVMNFTLYNAIKNAVVLMGSNVLGPAYSNVITQNIEMFDGIPILVTKNDDASNAILPMTETSSSSSVYFLKIPNGRNIDPRTGEMPNGVFAVSDGDFVVRGQPNGMVDTTYLDLMYAPVFPQGSAVRLQKVLATTAF